MAGRESVFNAIVEPDRESVLIGAIVLEDLDFLVDCVGQRLVPRRSEADCVGSGMSRAVGMAPSGQQDGD